VEWQRAFQKTVGSNILLLDSGFKICKEGMTTVMSGDGLVLGTWMGTCSLKLLAPYLAALGLRCAALGKVCTAFSVHVWDRRSITMHMMHAMMLSESWHDDGSVRIR
jgi:hypothetical protein